MLLGIMVCIFGAAALLAGKPDYFNYWGGSVSAVAALVVGALLILVALRSKPPQHPRKRGARAPSPASPRRNLQKP
jgi:hypothetical protein